MLAISTNIEKFIEHVQNRGVKFALFVSYRYITREKYMKTLLSNHSSIKILLFNITNWILLGRNTVRIQDTQNGYVATRLLHSSKFHLPELSKARIWKVSQGYPQIMKSKYTLDNFVEIDPNDVVFDVGAYVGAFSLAVANEASKVYAIEPSSENYNCLCKNTAEYDNIERIQKVLLNKEGSVELKLGRDSTDHSVIDIDGEETNKIEYIDGTRLDNLSQELDINEIDFLKLDAEGAEPEVLEGAQNVTVRKVAVDCGAERQGEKTSAEIKKLLQNRGYTVQSKNSIVFGRI